MSSAKKVVSKKVETMVKTVQITSYADKFLDRKENAALAIEIQNLKAQNAHLSDTLAALNDQMIVQVDLQLDVEHHNNKFKNSEAQREVLRQEIAKHKETETANEAAWQASYDTLNGQA